MELYITGPCGISYFYPGLGKIRALVGIINTGKNYFQGFSFCSYQPVFIKISKLPNELEKSLCHTCVFKFGESSLIYKRSRWEKPPKFYVFFTPVTFIILNYLYTITAVQPGSR